MDRIEVETPFFKKCKSTYSTDMIAAGVEKVRGVIEYRGRHYVCTATYSGGEETCTLSEVRESRYFNGTPHRYYDHDWNAERNYHGIRFKHQGAWWVFTRIKVLVAMSAERDTGGPQASLLAFA